MTEQRCADTTPHHRHTWGSASTPRTCPGYAADVLRPRQRRDETLRGLAKQQAADTAIATGPRCDDVRRLGGSAWVCIRPPHDAGHRDVDAWRRRTSGAVQADRHTYASAPHLALVEPERDSRVP